MKNFRGLTFLGGFISGREMDSIQLKLSQNDTHSMDSRWVSLKMFKIHPLGSNF